MSLDARSRSSIYQKLVPTLGEHDANVLMSEFPSVEADELVTKQFLRAELGEVRAELADMRAVMEAQLHRQTLWLGSALAAATAFLAALGTLS
jgi:glutathione S-transferase